jgi:hypothetical protein
MINLIDVTRKDHLCALACSRDDGFRLMRREILSFIDNDILVGNRPAPNVG